MSEVQSRPAAPRGRTSSRGGRSSHGPRGGGRGGRHTTNGGKPDSAPNPSYEDEGEIGQLKKKYSAQLGPMKQLFSDWTDEDIVFALNETDGDLERTIDRITEGSISQWGEVKKTKDRSRSKVKDSPQTLSADASTAPPGRGSRGGRGGHEGSRPGRGGRASDRGGRGSSRSGRGASAAATNGNRALSTPAVESAVNGNKDSVPTDESPAWGAPVSKDDDDAAADSWETTAAAPQQSTDDVWKDIAASNEPASTIARPKSSVIPDGAKKSWASMFAKPTPPAVPRPAAVPAAAAASSKSGSRKPTGRKGDTERLPSSSDALPNADVTPPATSLTEPEPNITPSKDALTETNLEQVLDTSAGPPTATAASTIASSKDPRSAANTPFSSSAQLPTKGSQGGGYAATAYKATNTPGRTSSFQRRVLEQQEAVVMPGNRDVDRAGVQFGSLGLNGSSEDPDVDEEREDPETRTQPPQHSPVAQPRAALPPAATGVAQGLPAQAQPVPKEPESTPRQAPGLPALSQQSQHQQQAILAQQTSPQAAAAAAQPAAQQGAQVTHSYDPFDRYAQNTIPQDPTHAARKAYDPFGNQTGQAQSQSQQQQQQLDGYASQQQIGQAANVHQASTQAQQPQAGSLSSASNDYSSYYTSDAQRANYQQYYGSQYGQHSGQSQQDAGAAQHRAGSGYGQGAAATAAADPSASYPAGPAQTRLGQAGAAASSGHTTPNPSAAPGQPQHQGLHGQQSHVPGQQPQNQGGAHTGYPYGHPYYSSPYYAAYMNQFGYGQNYGGPYGGKGGPYGQPHQGYGMSPQGSFDHSSSPANVGGFGQGRDAAAHSVGGAADYGRAAPSHQTQQQASTGSGAYGSLPDVFGRGGFQSQNQNQQHQHQATNQPGGADDTLKGFGDVKAAGGAGGPSGPSPALNQPGRPGSAVGSAAIAQEQPAGPLSQHSQTAQQGYGGYPSHLNHNTHGGAQGAQYGGLGGLGGGHQASGQQSHQGGGGYGGYGSGYNSNYYGSGGRGGGGSGGGWGGNYGH
ncbi:MAG: hypothetical protein M1825_002235 [Sarcosagium campestre]|nr:MAG: hypothetical protein M1825_002235 [Sarcosagium campestre]